MDDDTFKNRCRCDGQPMNGSDHCPFCYCEEYEERCEWPYGRPWQSLDDSEKYGLLMRQMCNHR